jgi:cytochrome b561
MEQHLRTIRYIHFAILVSVVLYIALAEFVKRDSNGDISSEIYWTLAIVGAGLAATAFLVRQMMLDPAHQTLHLEPNDAAAVGRWRVGHIMIFSCCEGLVICGFLARFLDSSVTQALPFYAVGIILLLLFYPRTP